MAAVLKAPAPSLIFREISLSFYIVTRLLVDLEGWWLLGNLFFVIDGLLAIFRDISIAFFKTLFILADMSRNIAVVYDSCNGFGGSLVRYMICHGMSSAD